MFHKLIGNNVITTPFLRFETDSGATLDPTFTTGGTATFEWISPDGSISTGATPNPALDQTGAYTVKCSDWSDVTELDIQSDNLIRLDNLHLLSSSLTTLSCRSNNIPRLEVVTLTLLIILDGSNNNMIETNVDHILADLVTAGVINGAVDISGTNAAPSAAGLANKAILEGRGWVVTVS